MKFLRHIIGFAIVLGVGSAFAAAQDNLLETNLKKAFAAGELEGLHSVLVMREGKVLAEVHFKGKDERWGSWLGIREHGPDTLHDLRSVTKSIVGLLYGIALGEGKVPAVDQPLLAQFPEYADLRGEEQREAITIEHALTMQMGTKWDETIPYSNPKNSEIAMEHAKDRFRYVLDRPMVHEPGSNWIYSGGATAIVAKLIEDGTGQSIDAYAKEKLFKQLGFSHVDWVNGLNGKPSTASGLRLNIHDLAKIGRLVADNGAYEGKQIVPAEWIEASLKPHAKTIYGARYGYFWWLAPEGTPPIWMAGFGNGGQRLTIGRESKTVVALFAGNYNKEDAWRLPVKVISEFVVPALKNN